MFRSILFLFLYLSKPHDKECDGGKREENGLYCLAEDPESCATTLHFNVSLIQWHSCLGHLLLKNLKIKISLCPV